MAAYAALVGIYLILFGIPSRVLSDDERGPRTLPTTRETGEFWRLTSQYWAYHALVALAVLLIAVAVARWLGIRVTDLGVRPGWTRYHDPRQRRRWRRHARLVFCFAMVAFSGAQLASTAIATVVPDHLAPLERASPTPEGMVAAGAAALPLSVTTAVVEQSVIVCLLVTLLAAARRRPGEIYIVAAASVVGYTIEDAGLACLPGIAQGLAASWLYLRTGRFSPIVLAPMTLAAGTSILTIVAGAVWMM